MSVFDKPIEELTESENVRGLIECRFSERRYIDYKRTLPDIRTDEAKSVLDDPRSATIRRKKHRSQWERCP